MDEFSIGDNNEFTLVQPDGSAKILKRTGDTQFVSLNLPIQLVRNLKAQFDVRTLDNSGTILWNWDMLGKLQEWIYDQAILPNAQKSIDEYAETLRQKEETMQRSESEHRLGQDKLRSLLIAKYHGCMITGIKETHLLIASHIKEWEVCNGARERLDLDNTLLLSVTYDALFDKHYITFHPESGKMLKSDKISDDTLIRLGIPNNWRKTITIQPYLSEQRSNYLRYHFSKTVTSGH